MNELASAPISPWYAIPLAVGLLAFSFAFAPGVLLHLGVLIYPKGHERRAQFIADLYDVPFTKRPFWVAGALVRCIFEGPKARLRSRRITRDLALLLLPDEDLQHWLQRHESRFLTYRSRSTRRFNIMVARQIRRELQRREHLRREGN